MDLVELQTLVTVVQAGSFTRAADILGTQKSYLSRVLTTLEKKLGVRLLERSTRSMHLTEIGREVYERAVGILGAVQDTRHIAQRLNAEPRGTLKLTTSVEFGMIAVGSWIDRYLQRHPGVNVDAEFTGRILDIVHEGFDLAIRVGTLDDSRLVARPLGALEYGLYASPAYLRRHTRPRHPDDLSGHALLFFTSSSNRGHWRLVKGKETIRVDGPARLRMNNSFALRDAALAGLGITRLPVRVAAQEFGRRRLVRVLPDWQPPSIPVNAVFASSRYLSAKVRAFIDLALDAFSSNTQ